MKLAEALILRGDQQKKIISLRQRIQANAQVQEGETPSEDPNDLLKQAIIVSGELHKMILRIHRTNAQSVLPDNRSLLDVLIERDALSEQHKILTAAIENARREVSRYSAREIKWTTSLSVADLQKRADEIAIKLRDLNIKTQAANWQVELLD